MLPDLAANLMGNLTGTQSAIAWVIALITDGLKEWQAMFNRASPRCVLCSLQRSLLHATEKHVHACCIQIYRLCLFVRGGIYK